MKPLRVLLVSNGRPSRTWTFANRLTCEISGITFCGIIQRPLQSLSRIQRLVATRELRQPAASGWFSKGELFLRYITTKLIDSVVWMTHGFPAGLNSNRKFTIQRLGSKCAEKGWPLVVIGDINLCSALNSLSAERADLVILLGEFPSIQHLPLNAPKGFIRARCHSVETKPSQPQGSALICVEHLRSGSEPWPIASVELPWQRYDGLLGFILKTELIADDLLLQTAASLRTSDLASTSALVRKWSERILEPCLRQLQPGDCVTPQNAHVSKYCRTKWKLCLDTLLLYSPWIFFRNCYRRWRKKYPILILAHHLVADRPHRMGVSTEDFLELILYLQRHYRIVSLSQAVELLQSGEIQVPTVVLTFDDGYADNFLCLRAVAYETGIPATLFITTDPVETQKEFGHDLMKGMTGFLPLTWDQIQYWSTRGVEFGSHTRTHMDCGTPDSAKLRYEIIGSKGDLESRLGVPVSLFAFPYGQRENMSSEAMRLAASTYSYFVSCFGGEAPSRSQNPQCHLFRKTFYPSQWELELELQSVFDVSAVIRRLFSFWKEKGFGDEDRTPSSPQLNAAVNVAVNQGAADHQSFPPASGKADYQSSVR